MPIPNDGLGEAINDRPAAPRAPRRDRPSTACDRIKPQAMNVHQAASRRRPPRPLRANRRRKATRSPIRRRRSPTSSSSATSITATRRVVLRPGSAAEVAAILKLANETRTAIVPQGGNTGLVGGQMPHNGEIVLSLNAPRPHPRGRSDLEHHDLRGRRRRSAAAQKRRPSVDRLFPLPLGVGRQLHHRRQSLDQCGRHRALAYGVARDLVLGLEVVLADGRVLEHSQQAQEGQHRLRPAQPVHRRRRHARHHHRRGAEAVPAPARGRDRVRRRALAAGGARSARPRRRSAPAATSPASN